MIYTTLYLESNNFILVIWGTANYLGEEHPLLLHCTIKGNCFENTLFSGSSQLAVIIYSSSAMVDYKLEFS